MLPRVICVDPEVLNDQCFEEKKAFHHVLYHSIIYIHLSCIVQTVNSQDILCEYATYVRLSMEIFPPKTDYVNGNIPVLYRAEFRLISLVF